MRTKSNLFNTQNINTDEYLLLAKVWKENGTKTEDIPFELEAIDDMLSILKMQSIIKMQTYTKTGKKRKDSDLSSLISARIGQLIEDLK
jgi:hypothetical protein